MRTRHAELDEDSRDSIDPVDNEYRISTRSRSRALGSSPRVIVRQRLQNRGLGIYMPGRKRKKYFSYPDIEYAAAKRTKPSSDADMREALNCPPCRSRTHSQDIACSPRRTRTQRRLVSRQPSALSRLKRDLGEGYEEVIEYSTDKPYGLRRERQIVMRYEAPDFRDVHQRSSSDEVDEDEEDEQEEEDQQDTRSRGYSLRTKPPKVVRYEDSSFSEHKRYHRYMPQHQYHRTFTHHTQRGEPRRTLRPGDQSTTSESETEKEEKQFEKRKKKSMGRARARCLPMNMALEDIHKGLYRERLKAGASMADIDPMSLDKTVNFTCIGGLDKHLHSLREMIIFPMLYPEVFDKFAIAPPRGVIFYGSPGTGKTLVARALANECSKEGQKISFFMRKGADCLSKWVGESERQLRLLFDQAYSLRPSIIFFDEIDGLAPVRSSRQEQIHSSIVSTLLALMDGLDSRGEVVVIGATNRLDAIDPALRRPGRFDREFHFPLPTAQARCEILQIHTAKWNPVLHPELVAVLADRTVGYCGADLKALVTESALIALRRRYPQIYHTNKRLLLDPANITVRAQDFYLALQRVQGSHSRTIRNIKTPLPQHTRPLLSEAVTTILEYILRVMPGLTTNTSGLTVECSRVAKQGDNVCTAEHLVAGEPELRGTSSRNTTYRDIDTFFITLSSYFSHVPSYRPRLLLRTHNTLVVEALLHTLEEVTVHEISLSSLHSPCYRSVEEAASQIIESCIKKTPCILYIPHLDVLETSCSISVCNILYTLLKHTTPGTRMLLLATLSDELDESSIFSNLFNSTEILDIPRPTPHQILLFFKPLLTEEIYRTFTVDKQTDERLEELEEAPPIQPQPLTDEEIAAIEKQEDTTRRELRLFLRDIVNKIMKERKFYCFCKPVNLEEVLDYMEVISQPMDLEKIRENIDHNKYTTVKHFTTDIELVSENAMEYNPPDDHTGRQIRHRAAELKDYAHSLIDAELDLDFEKLCEDIEEAREQRQLRQCAQSRPPSRTSTSRTSTSRSSRHSLVEDTKPSVNGRCEDDADKVLADIVNLLKDREIEEMLKLHTSITQLIIQHRGKNSKEFLLKTYIPRILLSFS